MGVLLPKKQTIDVPEDGGVPNTPHLITMDAFIPIGQ